MAQQSIVGSNTGLETALFGYMAAKHLAGLSHDQRAMRTSSLCDILFFALFLRLSGDSPSRIR